MPSEARPQGQPALRPGLTKRQTEVLERLEQGIAVKRIARDLGVTRNAVYQTIERLRRQGALPETYTPSGQPAVGGGELPPGAGAAVSRGLAPRESRLAELRGLAAAGTDGDQYAALIEAAIAQSDVAALAYELGRADARGDDDLPKRLAEAALRRLGALPTAEGETRT
jgi:DNA-binding CsgD family transcriptional regulator